MIQHKGKRSGLVAIVPARPENTAENGKNSDCERTNGEHEKRVDYVSTVHAPSEAPRQSEKLASLAACAERPA
jgi:hypothetical protein